MALSRTQVAQAYRNYTTANWTSGSFSADADDLLVVVVQWQRAQSGGWSSPEWTVTSTGMSFTREIDVENGATTWPSGIEIYTDIVPSTGSRTVTVATNSQYCIGHVTVFKYCGVDTTTPVRQAKANTNTSVATGSYSYNLDSAPLSTSEVLAAESADTWPDLGMALTPGTGWTELLDTYLNSDPYGSNHLMYRGNSTSTSISYDDINENSEELFEAQMFAAIEIAAAALPSSTGYSFSMIY